MAQTKNKSFCSVPQCSNSKQKQPYLHFHEFPQNEELRGKWIRAVRREEGKNFVISRGSTLVCSQHFNTTDYHDGGVRLKTGVVPSRFRWNNFQNLKKRHSVNKPSAHQRVDQDTNKGGRNQIDHNYVKHLPPSASDDARVHVAELKPRLQPVSMTTQTISSQFTVSNETMRYYTGFPSQEVFRGFWESVCPSMQHIVYWTRAQAMGEQAFPAPSADRRIPAMEELFIYCCRVAGGLKEQLIADIFQTSTSTVSRVIVTWANYLFLVLGSLPIWMSRQQVEISTPSTFRLHGPKLRVILNSTEVRCESPAMDHKSTTTFKGLVGVSPCGAVTFISPLYAASISDKELTRRSGVLDLLESGDQVMADERFAIEDLLSGVGASLVIPPRKRKSPLGKAASEQMQAAARLRSLVGRVICRVKENHIWDGVVPLRLSGSVSQIWHNCCLMVNYQM